MQTHGREHVGLGNASLGLVHSEDMGPRTRPMNCVSNQDMRQRFLITVRICATIVSVCMLSAQVLGQASAPRKVNDVKPVYPRESLRAGDEGVVLIELSVTASGTVGETRILWSGCQRLDQAALIAVSQWRYDQVRVNGNAVPSKVVTEVPFRLPTAFRSRVGRPDACRWKEPPKRIVG